VDLTLLWLQLAAVAGVILVTAHFMARSADIIAEKTGLGRSFVGVVMLATATSLPELGTGVSSIVLVGEVDLAAGDAFGSNLFNLLIIGLLDMYWRRGPVLAYVSATSGLVGVLGVLVISTAVIAIIFHDLTTNASTWYVSPVSFLMFGTFLVAMYLIFRAEHSKASATSDDDTPDIASNYAGESLTRAFVIYAITASVVVGAAIWLAYTGDRVADAMGWEASFMGTQFLALSTSLPELAASLAALRLGAPELAITNVLGSNLFNMGFVLFLDDVAFNGGVLWRGIDDIHILTAVIAVLMTSIVVVGIQTTDRNTTARPFITVPGAAMILLYVVTSVLVFYLA
jgi:cation:H+ antiporter